MKRRGFYVLAGALLAGLAGTTRAEPPPHLEFVQALRAKNYSDLALEYLDRLAKNDPPADLVPYLPLERARTQLEMAVVEFNSAKREALFQQARTGFQNFLKARPNDPLAAEAAFDSARILALEGRAIVTRSRVHHEGKVQDGDAHRAIEKFGDKGARKELSEAIEKIKDALANKSPPPNVQKSLEATLLWATLELNIVRLDNAAMIEATNGNGDEAQRLKLDAITALTDKDGVLIGKDKNSPVYWLAHAWIYKAQLELTLGDKAKAELDLVLAGKGPAADPGKRLARYLRFMDDVNGSRVKDVHDHGVAWLAEYRSFSRSAEGAAIQFQLGKLYFDLVRERLAEIEKGGKVDPKTKENIDNVLKYLKPLIEPETDYSQLADEMVGAITAALNGLWDGNLAEVTTFDRADALAHALAAKLYKLPKEEKDKTLGKILSLLFRATSLADKTIPEAKVADVRSNLSYIFLTLDKPLQAVVAGEDVAYHSKSPKAAAGAGYAIQAYLLLIEQGTQANTNQRFIDVDRDRLAALFDYMKKTWPTDNATDTARHRMGDSLIRQERFEEAAKILGEISSSYTPAVYRLDASFQLARTLQKLAADPKVTEEKKKVYQKQILAALRDAGSVAIDDSAPFGPQLYVQSQLMLGYTLYETKEYKELDDVSDRLAKKLAKFTKLDAAVKADLQKTVDALTMWARFGRATADLNAGKVKEAEKETNDAIALVTKAIDEFKKLPDMVSYQAAQKKFTELADKESPTDDEKKKLEEARAEVEKFKEKGEPIERQLNNYVALLRGLTIVSLRANIQAGNMARAQQVLTALQSADSGVGGAGIYRQLVSQFTKQIHDLETDSKTKDQGALLKKNFAEFLDKLGTDEKMPVTMRFFLASSNSSLDRHAQAADLLGKVPEPTRPAKGKPPADLKLEGEYRAARRMQVHEYTLAGKFKEAADVVAAAEKTSDAWGLEDIEMLKAKASLYQAQALASPATDKVGLTNWALATKSWADVTGRLQKKFIKTKLPKDREAYSEATHEWLFCLSHYTAISPAEKKPELIKRLAGNLFKFETAQPDFGGEVLTEKFKKLINGSPEVRKEYDELKKTATAASAK